MEMLPAVSSDRYQETLLPPLHKWCVSPLSTYSPPPAPSILLLCLLACAPESYASIFLLWVLFIFHLGFFFPRVYLPASSKYVLYGIFKGECECSNLCGAGCVLFMMWMGLHAFVQINKLSRLYISRVIFCLHFNPFIIIPSARREFAICL